MSIAGDDNVIEVFTEASIAVSGDGNLVRGIVKGEVDNFGSDNNLSGIKGFSGVGRTQGTTDANGRITQDVKAHPSASGLGISAIVNDFNNPWSVRLYSLSSGVATFVVVDAAGDPVANTEVNIRWVYG